LPVFQRVISRGSVATEIWLARVSLVLDATFSELLDCGRCVGIEVYTAFVEAAAFSEAGSIASAVAAASEGGVAAFGTCDLAALLVLNVCGDGNPAAT
jgi:hypothetical protein